jgi:hypothetical protein
MKRTLLAIATLFLTGTGLFAQEQTIIAKFIISDARKNKVDATEEYLNNQAYFVFYKLNNDPQTRFGIIMPKSNSQSFGKIFDRHTSVEAATDHSYKTEIYFFKWSYINSYDDNVGTASVKLVKIYKPAGVAFEITVVPDNLDVLEYKGYMDGSLKDLE